jgi:hypothetical protein
MNDHASAAPNCRQPRPPPRARVVRVAGGTARTAATCVAGRLIWRQHVRGAHRAGLASRGQLCRPPMASLSRPLLLHLEINRIGAVIRSIKACNLCKCSHASLSHGNHEKIKPAK